MLITLAGFFKLFFKVFLLLLESAAHGPFCALPQFSAAQAFYLLRIAPLFHTQMRYDTDSEQIYQEHKSEKQNSIAGDRS